MTADLVDLDIRFATAEIDDLRRRIRATRWPDHGRTDWSRGVPLGYLQELAAYWSDRYDWTVFEDRLAQWPHSRTDIGGQPIHFVHLRSPEPDALPVMMIHGWPGSIVEFLDVAGPLADPRSHGGDPADAFNLVLPSLPGHGFSMPLTEDHWGPSRIAMAFAELMRRLGYRRYLIQGGDWGAMIAREVARHDPESVVAMHVNTLFTFPAKDFDAATLDPAEAERFRALRRWDREDSGYRHLQATRPETIGFALTDSPVGQLAWIAEKFFEWTDSRSAPDDAIDRDHLLTNVTLYWLTRTAGSSANLYYEAAHQKMPTDRVSVPLSVSTFAHDVPLPIRALAESQNNVVSWREHDRGGHFAAMEQPEVFIDDVRDCFREWRGRP